MNNIKANTAKGKTYHSSASAAEDIYTRGGIPIMCYEHGWFEPKEYRVRRSHTMGVSFMAVTGRCPKCKNDCDKAFPDMMSKEGLLFAHSLQDLTSKGKVIDER